MRSLCFLPLATLASLAIALNPHYGRQYPGFDEPPGSCQSDSQCNYRATQRDGAAFYEWLPKEFLDPEEAAGDPRIGQGVCKDYSCQTVCDGCTEDQYCYSKEKRCRPLAAQDNDAECIVPEDCKSFLCSNGKCQALVELGGQCAEDNECQSSKCVLQKCSSKRLDYGELCKVADDCTYGVCTQGVCRLVRGSNGDTCSLNTECSWGYCREGKCGNTIGLHCKSLADCKGGGFRYSCSETTQKCEVARSEGESCERTSQCGEGQCCISAKCASCPGSERTECSSNKMCDEGLICYEGPFRDGKKTCGIPDGRLFGPCSDQYPCDAPNECRDGYCQLSKQCQNPTICPIKKCCPGFKCNTSRPEGLLPGTGTCERA